MKIQNNNIKILWSGIDSNVYLEDGIVRKYYMHPSALMDDLIFTLSDRSKEPNKYKNILSKEVLNNYHQLLHELSKFNFTIKNIRIKWISKIKLKILDLWDVKINTCSLITNRAEIIIADCPIVETNTETIKAINWLWNVDYKKIYSIIDKHFMKIWLWCIWKIHPMNYIITWFDKWVLEITITDIWNDIYNLMRRKAEDIKKRISRNKWKTWEKYEIAPKTE